MILLCGLGLLIPGAVFVSKSSPKAFPHYVTLKLCKAKNYDTVRPGEYLYVGVSENEECLEEGNTPSSQTINFPESFFGKDIEYALEGARSVSTYGSLSIVVDFGSQVVRLPFLEIEAKRANNKVKQTIPGGKPTKIFRVASIDGLEGRVTDEDPNLCYSFDDGCTFESIRSLGRSNILNSKFKAGSIDDEVVSFTISNLEFYDIHPDITPDVWFKLFRVGNTDSYNAGFGLLLTGLVLIDIFPGLFFFAFQNYTKKKRKRRRR